MTEDERARRIHHHTYETCEGIAEHAERIVDLEELALDMWRLMDGGGLSTGAYGPCEEIRSRAARLGLQFSYENVFEHRSR